jgi:hypothetical protein
MMLYPGAGYPGEYFPVQQAGAEVALLRTGFIGLTWLEFLKATGAYEVWGKIALPDPASYYHGFKDDRVARWGSIRRGLSDRLGNYVSSTFSWLVNDTDRAIRALLAAPLTQYFPSTSVTVRMIDDPSRRLLLTPRTVFKGLVDDYRPLKDLQFDFKAVDLISKRFAAHNGLMLPQRTITTTDFANADADITAPAVGNTRGVGAVGKGIPIIYGEVSDRDLHTEIVPVPSVLPVDTTIAVPDNQYAQDVAGAGTLDGWVTGRVTAVVGGSESPPGVVKAATFWEGRAVRFYWNKVDAADSYRLYISENGGWDPNGLRGTTVYGRLLTHDLTLDGAPPDGLSKLFTAWTDGTDVFTGTNTTVTIDRGRGLIKPIYVGDETIGGTVYRVGLYAGHACKSILAGYLNDKAVTLASDADWLTPNNVAAWAAAGFTTSYRDINGRRYSLIYLKGTPGEVLAGTIAAAEGSPGITLNVQGIETVGDGSGTLITDIHDQYLHAMQNWVLADYQSGAWLGDPTFADETTLAMIDAASYASAKTAAALRVSGGYPGTFVIGANGTLTSIRDFLAQMNLSADVDCYFNRNTQFAISMETENIASLNAAVTLDDTHDIFTGSFDVQDRLNEHFNVVPYVFQRDWSARADTWRDRGEYSDATSITKYRETKRSQEIQLWAIRDTTVAADIAQRRLRRTKNPPRYVSFTVGLQGANLELGDIVKVTHHEGIGAAGWTNNLVRLTRHELDPESFTVMLEGYDMSGLFGTAFILGDRTVLPADWDDASVEQQFYGYLADRTTGQFTGGDNGKRLI